MGVYLPSNDDRILNRCLGRWDSLLFVSSPRCAFGLFACPGLAGPPLAFDSDKFDSDDSTVIVSAVAKQNPVRSTQGI